MLKPLALTQPEAWRAIAEAFSRRTQMEMAVPVRTRVGTVLIPNRHGLCDAIDSLRQYAPEGGFERTLSVRMRRKMHAQVKRYLPRNQPWAYYTNYGYGRSVHDTSPESQRARAMAALWLALDAELEMDIERWKNAGREARERLKGAPR